MRLKQEAEILRWLRARSSLSATLSVTEASAKVTCCICQAHGWPLSQAAMDSC